MNILLLQPVNLGSKVPLSVLYLPFTVLYLGNQSVFHSLDLLCEDVLVLIDSISQHIN